MKSRLEIEQIRKEVVEQIKARNGSKDGGKRQILICGGTGCTSSESISILNCFNEEIEKNGIQDKAVTVRTGCFGLCELGPIVIVYPEGSFYSRVKIEDVPQIVAKHLVNGEPVKELLCPETVKNGEIKPFREMGFYRSQNRVALRNCGVIDPECINEYLARDGYKALEKALLEMEPQEVIDTIRESGLRGRGGGGFLTGVKWQFAASQVANQKYIICNADEGDPGAFMDRSILEGDPQAVVEAMAIAGYAIGATQAFIYVRAEYPIAVGRLKIAIKQAKEYGILGENIFGSGFNFDLDVRLGSGAFVCGEETALLNSIEGKRGMPRPRPPFPAVKGLWGKPTIINNVETLSNIPQIILQGKDWFKSMGTTKSTGTKVFALGGKVKNTGLVEIPMGTTLRHVIYDIGGGIPNGKEFKAVQTGGPSGGCLTKDHLDTPIEYDTLTALGSMMGSGGMIVMDEDNCMVDIARFFLEFIVDESCGKCTPCREGTKRMLELLQKITEGKGEEGDIERLESLANTIKSTSLCGLGQTAPNPVLSTIKYFRHEYEAHIKEKKCPAGACKSLVRYEITEDKCKMCGICANACPIGCIQGEVKKTPFVINQKDCVKCGTCFEKCPFKAIKKG